MIRDCSYYARRAEILEALGEIVAEIQRQDEIIDWQIADALHYGKAFTDPRDGVTYFPTPRSGSRTVVRIS
jgi:hypothetical protein